MGRAVILARVSTELQSLDSQVEKLVEEAKRLGYDDYVVVQAKESGVKLDTEERQTIQAMKDEIEKGGVEMVIIWEVSRLARRPKVLYEVREYLIKHNVNLRCMTPSFTMLQADGQIDPTASIVFAIFGTMAEQEAILSKQRMKRGRIAKRERLGFIGGNILFGYKVKDDKIVIDEDEAVYVREIFKRYTGGESILSIARDMISRGSLRYEDVSTAAVMLRRMIRRSEYAGIKMDTYDYPAIISTGEWESIRRTAESRDKMKVRTKTKTAYFGRGIIKDRDHGYIMTPSPGVCQYTCWNENTGYKRAINMNLAESVLAWAAQKWLKRSMLPENDAKMERAAIEWRDRKLKLDRDHTAIAKKIDKINERIINGKIKEDKGDEMIDKLNAEMKKVKSDIIVAEDRVNSIMQQRMKLLTGHSMDIYTMPVEEAAVLVHDAVEVMYAGRGSQKASTEIDIVMKDGVKHHISSVRKGRIYIIYEDGKEIDINIIRRVERKNYSRKH